MLSYEWDSGLRCGSLSLGCGRGKVVPKDDRLLVDDVTNQQSARPQTTLPHTKKQDSGSYGATLNPIYTKISRLEIPGKFFKRHPTKQNFRQTFSPGVVRGRATSLDGFVTPPRRKIPRTKGKK